MQMLAINHDVEDYDRWKAVFDEFTPVSAGALFHRVNRNVDEPDNVTVVAGFATTVAARAFVDNPELKAAMGRAGVTGPPRIEIFEEVEVVEA